MRLTGFPQDRQLRAEKLCASDAMRTTTTAAATRTPPLPSTTAAGTCVTDAADRDNVIAKWIKKQFEKMELDHVEEYHYQVLLSFPVRDGNKVLILMIFCCIS